MVREGPSSPDGTSQSGDESQDPAQRYQVSPELLQAVESSLGDSSSSTGGSRSGLDSSGRQTPPESSPEGSPPSPETSGKGHPVGRGKAESLKPGGNSGQSSEATQE